MQVSTKRGVSSKFSLSVSYDVHFCGVSGYWRYPGNGVTTLYNLVELKSFVRKLLTQFARDQRETREYYRAPHGDGYKGVDGR